jgi:hypothetical protein
MGKTRNTGFSNNAIQYNSGSIAFVSSSTTLLNISSSGNIVTTGTITAQTLVVQTVTSSISFVTGSTKFGVISSNTHQFTGSLNVTGALYVATGSVGIGTVSPSQLFEVVGGEIKAGRVDTSQEGGQVSFGRSTDNATAWYIDAYGSTASPQFRFINVTNAAVVMTMTGSNVGIGTSSPNGKLHIEGSGNVFTRTKSTSSDGVSAFIATNDLNQACEIGIWGSARTGFGTIQPPDGYIYGATDLAISSATNIKFGTGASNTERMRITSGGFVLIGTTTTNSWPLEIEAGGGGEQIYLKRSGANAQIFMGGSTGAGTNLFIRANGSNGVYMSANATSWTNNSDERLKNINSNIENAVEKLLTLRTVNFSWKADETNKENLGLIAQDVEVVFPQVIDKSKINENKGDEIEYLGVRYTEMIPVLVKAIQELKAENDALKTRIETLENK